LTAQIEQVQNNYITIVTSTNGTLSPRFHIVRRLNQQYFINIIA